MKSPLKTALAATIAVLCLTASASADNMRSCGRTVAQNGGYWYLTANHNTSCGLARNVAWGVHDSLTPVAYSPVTNRYYRFACYRSGHTYTYARYTCISYADDGLLRVVLRG